MNLFQENYHKIINLIFPKYCLICNKAITNGKFCIEDWNKIHFISKPYCYICHHPFEYNIDDKMLCANCLQKKPYYKKLVATCIYNDLLANLIIKFKFSDQNYLAKDLSDILYPKLLDFIDKIDFITAVPLHKNRLKKRKYNQSLFLAKNISKKTSIKLLPDLLIRIKEGENQIGLNKNARIANVKNSFIINDKYKMIIKNKNILIIDDVVTTSATLNNCAKILKKNAVLDVFAAVLAKRIL